MAHQALKIGCRVAVSFPKLVAGDSLLGAQNVLTDAGRKVLSSTYKDAQTSGADMVSTGINVSTSFLDANGFFNDFSRENDVSYYITGKGNVPVEINPRGYKLCVPRSGVSAGEKLKFSGMLGKIATSSVKNAVGGGALTGASVTFTPDAKKMAPATADFIFAGDSGNLGDQMLASAEALPDFFVVHGCSSSDDFQYVADTLKKLTPKTVKEEIFDTKGFKIVTDTDVTTGFDIPLILMTESKDAFEAALGAAPEIPQVVCVSSHEPMHLEANESRGFSIAEPSSNVGEIVVVS